MVDNTCHKIQETSHHMIAEHWYSRHNYIVATELRINGHSSAETFFNAYVAVLIPLL